MSPSLHKAEKVNMGSISATSRDKREDSAMADASGLLHTLQGHVEDIRALLQCGICVRPLYEPYTLACGHTFCYGCLTSWFKSGRSHKTCPDCRAQVKIQPAPAYLVRTIVQLFTSNAELLEKDETTAEHSKNQREEAERLEADKSNEDPSSGGLFQGFFKPKPHAAGPIFDAEDGIARCPNCAWELEEDSCMNCGYHVEDGTISSMSDDDISDMTDDDDDDDSDDDDDDDEEEMGDADGGFVDHDGAWVDEYPHPLPFSFQQIYGAAQHFGPHPHHHHNHNPFHPYHQFLANPIFRRPPNFTGGQPSSSITHTSDSEEDEEDEDEDMDSFIDDGEPGVYDSDIGSHTDNSTVVGSIGRDDYHHGFDGYDDDSIQGDESVEDAESDEESDDYDDDESIRPAPSRRTGQPSQSQNIRSANRGRNISSSPRPPFSSPPPSTPSVFSPDQNSPAAGTSANNAINLDDDSEDEMPVAATRRGRNRR